MESNKTCLGKVIEFQTYCKEHNISIESKYHCLNDLSKQINKKKGAYTDDERIEFMKMITTCISAPNVFFGQELTWNEYLKLTKKARKEITDFLKTIKSIEHDYHSFRNYCGSVGLYIKYITSLLRKQSSSRQDTELSSLVLEIKKQIEEYLKNTDVRLGRSFDYTDMLYRCFEENGYLMEDSVFRSFLPYYLFFEISKTIGYIRVDDKKKTKKSIKEKPDKEPNEKTPFTVIGIPSNKSSLWNMRSSPLYFKEGNQLEDIKEAVALYDQIKSIVSKIMEKSISTIGTAVYNSLFQLVDEKEEEWLTFNMSSDYFTLPSIDLPVDIINEDIISNHSGTLVESYAFFYLPMFISEDLCRVLSTRFKLSKEQEKKLLEDFEAIYLSSLKRDHKDLEEISKQYTEYSTKFSGNNFLLSDVLKTITIIFNPDNFSAETPFACDQLKRAINLLANFYDTKDESEHSQYKCITSRRWREILADICKCEKRFDEISYFDPNDVLVRALFKKYLDFIRQNRSELNLDSLTIKTFNYDYPYPDIFWTSLFKIISDSDANWRTEQWTGLNFNIYNQEMDRNSITKEDMFILWAQRCPQEVTVNMEVICYLRKHIKELMSLLDVFKPIHRNKHLAFLYKGKNLDNFIKAFECLEPNIHTENFDKRYSYREEYQRKVEELRTALEQRKTNLVTALATYGAKINMPISDFQYYSLVRDIIMLFNSSMFTLAEDLLKKIQPNI